MKLLNYILASLIVIGIILYFLFPKGVLETETVKGKAKTLVINQSKFDSLEYVYEAKFDSLLSIKRKPIYLKGKTIKDTTIIHDTTYLSYWALFDFGNDTLGTSGKVVFDMNDFKFSDIEYRYPKEFSSRVDTLKLTKAVKEPYYLDEWFYSSIVLFLALLASLVGG